MDYTILITRPDHDITTRYLKFWNKKVIEIASDKGIKILDLEGIKANRNETESRLKKMSPAFVFLNGHGDSDCVAGYNDEILVRAGENEKLLKDKIVYALSCKSASKLGRASVKSGAKAYIGYIEDFIFCHENNKLNNPLSDKTAELFLKPANQVSLSLIKGNSGEESCKKSKRYFLKNIQKLLSSSSENNPQSTQYAQFLWWDMKNQVCLS